MKKAIYLITTFIFFSCSKENKTETNNSESYHELKSGSYGLLFYYSNVRSSYSIGYDSFVKINNGIYKLIGVQGQYNIDTIQLFKNSNKLIMSKYKYYDQTDEWSKLFEKSFRNAKSITSDSIIAEYYNTNARIGRFDYVPDSGIIAIKINP
jgi:hypothetical protein